MSVSEWLQPIVAKKGVVKLTSSGYGPSHSQTLDDESRQSYGFMPDPPNGFTKMLNFDVQKERKEQVFLPQWEERKRRKVLAQRHLIDSSSGVLER